MTVFKHLPPDVVAAQHQLILDLLLQAVGAMEGGSVRRSLVDSITRMISLSRETGFDTTVLELTLDGIGRQDDAEATP